MYYKQNDDTYDSVFDKLLAPCEFPFLLTKELSLYFQPEEMTVDRMNQFQHLFLLRSPKACMESWWRASQSKENGGYFEANEAGFRELAVVYKWVKENVDENPLVIEGDDFVEPEKTEKVFRHICETVGMEFDEHMLTWEQTKVNDNYPAFHEGINKSTGIQKIEHAAQEYPKCVTDAIEENAQYYNEFLPHFYKP